MTTLKDLGYPTQEQFEQLGLSGREFVDIVHWMQRGKKRFGDGWIRRVWPVTGWEVLEFINDMQRRRELDELLHGKIGGDDRIPTLGKSYVQSMMEEVAERIVEDPDPEKP